MASPHAGQRRCRFTVTDGRESDHLRHVPTVRRRVSQRARGGPRHHDAKFTREVFRSLIKSMAPCSACRVLWLARHTTITPTPRWSGPTAPSAPTPTSPRTVLSSPARRCPCARSTLRPCSCGRLRVCDCPIISCSSTSPSTMPHIGARRRIDAFLYHPQQRIPASRSRRLTKTAPPASPALRAANATDGGDGAARCGAGGAEGEARHGPGRHGVPGGQPGAAADPGAARTSQTLVSCAHEGTVPSPPPPAGARHLALPGTVAGEHVTSDCGRRRWCTAETRWGSTMAASSRAAEGRRAGAAARRWCTTSSLVFAPAGVQASGCRVSADSAGA